MEVSYQREVTKGQATMATAATEEDTHQQVLIRGKWVYVPDSYRKNACGELKRDPQFISELIFRRMFICMGLMSGTLVVV